MNDMTPAEAAQVTFDGMNFDLNDLPTKKQLQTDANNDGLWIRVASLYLNDDDEELADQVWEAWDADELNNAVASIAWMLIIRQTLSD